MFIYPFYHLFFLSQASDFNAEGPTRRFNYNASSTSKFAAEAKAAEQNSRNASNNLSGMSSHDARDIGSAQGTGGGGDVNARAADAAAASTLNGEGDGSSRGRTNKKKKRRGNDTFNDSSTVVKSDVSYGGGNLWNEDSHKLVADDELKRLKVYRMGEVSAHNTEHDAWMVVHNVIYDVTAYLPSHPGGAALLIGLCGRDATQAFSRSHANQSKADDMLRKSPLIKKVGRLFTLNDSFGGEGGGGGSGNGSRQGSRQGSQRNSFSDRSPPAHADTGLYDGGNRGHSRNNSVDKGGRGSRRRDDSDSDD
jgi:cytochrome b involved in lipid metabolism